MWKLLMPMTLLVVGLSASALAEPPSGGGYRLDAGDGIRVKVFEWRNTVGEVHEWSALKGDYKIGPDGNVSLPLIGTTPAAGYTVDGLGAAIADRLKSALGLATQPQASVEVLEFRPFYVTGNVSHPGGYPYRPGLSVLQAVSIAGGLFRLDSISMVTTAGDLRVFRMQYHGLLVRRARLQAELSDSDKIAFPTELLGWQTDRAVAELIQQEQVMFTARKEAVRSQLDAQTSLKELLNGEIASLQAKLQTMDQELALLKNEKTRIASLVTQGLAIHPREFELRQTEIQAEGRRLDVESAMLRAREDLGRADQAITEIRDKRRSEILTELAQAEAKLSETAERIKTNATIVDRDESAEPASISMVDKQRSPPIYVIFRRLGTEIQEVPATEQASVEPGDTIEVRRAKPPAPAIALRSGSSLDSALETRANPLANLPVNPPANPPLAIRPVTENTSRSAFTIDPITPDSVKPLPPVKPATAHGSKRHAPATETKAR